MRLIDADNLADYITENGDAFAYAIEHKDRVVLEDAIASIPTAYDVDKVVEELEEWSFEAKILISHSNENGEYEEEVERDVICTKNAIDIVRGGENE